MENIPLTYHIFASGHFPASYQYALFASKSLFERCSLLYNPPVCQVDLVLHSV